MPRPPSSGQHVTHSYTVATANSTLNTFMGGKQKSWMSNTAPVQPSQRPPRPDRRPSQQLSPAIPPNLLPSPAPSDEPSPSLSNPTDSPGLRTRPLMQPQHTQPPSFNAPPAQQPFSPGPREQGDIVSDVVRPNTVTEVDSSNTTHAAPDQALPAAQSPPVMAAPRLLESSQVELATVMASVPVLIDPHHAAQSSHGFTEGPPAKKRRVE